MTQIGQDHPKTLGRQQFVVDGATQKEQTILELHSLDGRYAEIKKAYKDAAVHGQLATLSMLDERFPIDANPDIINAVIANAENNGHLNVIEWLYGHMFIDPDKVLVALRNVVGKRGVLHLNVLQWMYEKLPLTGCTNNQLWMAIRDPDRHHVCVLQGSAHVRANVFPGTRQVRVSVHPRGGACVWRPIGVPEGPGKLHQDRQGCG
jgi:hypothetical protein